MSLNLRHGLEAVVAELKRLRAEGVGSVYLTRETVAQLQERAKALETDDFASKLVAQIGGGAGKAPARRGAAVQAGDVANDRAKAKTAERKKNPFLEEASFSWPQGDSPAGDGKEAVVVAV